MRSGTSTTRATKDILLRRSNLRQAFSNSPIGSKVTFPLVPMLAVFIRGALMTTGKLAFGLSGGSIWPPPCKRVGCASAISLTFSDVSTSRILAARVCSRIVVGPWNCKKSWQTL